MYGIRHIGAANGKKASNQTDRRHPLREDGSHLIGRENDLDLVIGSLIGCGRRARLRS
jgi:hypothetical protein